MSDLDLAGLDRGLATIPGPLSRIGAPLGRSGFNMVSTRALKEPKAHEVFHSLRDSHAGLQNGRGELIETVQFRLGPASATKALDTRSYPWPDSGGSAGEAVAADLELASLAERANPAADPGGLRRCRHDPHRSKRQAVG